MEPFPEMQRGFEDPVWRESDSKRLRRAKNLLGILLAIVLVTLLFIFGEPSLSELQTLHRDDWLGFAAVGLPIGGFLFTTVTHELLHWIPDQLFGYDPRLLISPNPHVIVLEEYKSRSEMMMTLILPFAGLNLSLIPFLIFDVSPVMTYSAVYVLLLNSMFSGSDIYEFLFLIREPRGTMLYAKECNGGYRTYRFHPIQTKEKSS